MNGNGATPARSPKNSINLADYITSEDAAADSGYHVNYIRRLLRQGKIEGRKFGNVWFIERASFQEYLELVNRMGGHKFQGTPTIEERTGN